MNRALLEKLLVTQLENKFPAFCTFCGTQSFITVFTRASRKWKAN